MNTQINKHAPFQQPVILENCGFGIEPEDEQTTPEPFIPRLKAGDPQAFADLYRIYRRRVFGRIMRIVENPSVAEDLCQESFFKLWRAVSRLNPEYEVVPWLMRIARNCALDYRKSTGNFRFEQIVYDHAMPVEPQNMDWKRSELRQAFEQLPPDQKEVILLSFYEGLSQVEIAERLGQPLGTIKGRVRSGLSKLRAAMEANSDSTKALAREI